MSIYIYFFAFLLASTSVNPQDPIQRYVIRKDFFSGLKPAEFSIYDTSEKHVYYRIESDYGIMQNAKIIVHPSKQVIGRLQAKIKPLVYKAEISLLDSQSNQWINGIIEQNFQLLGNLFNIDWNKNRITMGNDVGTLTVKFHDTNSQLLAQFRIRPASILWTRKYDMQIFSSKYPEQIYLLGLVAYDHTATSKKYG